MFNKKSLVDKNNEKKESIFRRNLDKNENSTKIDGIKKYTRKKKQKNVHIFNNLINKDVLDKSKSIEDSELSKESHSLIFESSNLDFDDVNFTIDSDSDSGLVDLDTMITPGKPLNCTNTLDLNFDQELPEIKTSTKFQDEILSHKVANGNILSALHDYSRDKIESTRERFKDYNIPDPIQSKKLLLERIKKYLHMIPEILNGKIEMSFFYDLAKEQKAKSGGEQLNLKEKFLIDWSKFFGGYYGFKRQLFIASVIISRCRKELNSALKKNRTLAYWSPTGFSTYILANEIIIRLTMEDFNCDYSKAELLIKDTVDYGMIISDTVDLIDDLDIGEMLQEESKIFMKDIQNQSESQNENNKAKINKMNNAVLENILNISFSSDDES